MYGRDEHYDLCTLARFYIMRLEWDQAAPAALCSPPPPTREDLAHELRIPWSAEAEEYVRKLLTKLVPFLRGTIALQIRADALADVSDEQWTQGFGRLRGSEQADVALRWRKRVRSLQTKNITPARTAEFLVEIEDRREVEPDFAVAVDQEIEALRCPQVMVQRIQAKIAALQREQQRWMDKL